MSFIFEDQELLNQLIKIAQEEPRSQRIKNVALKLVNNLKQEYNPLQVAGSLSATDLSSPYGMREWLKKNQAKYNGKRIVDDDGKVDQPGYFGFLSQLQKQYPEQKERLANLIGQVNRESGQEKLSPYAEESKTPVVEQDKTTQPKQQQQDQKTDQSTAPGTTPQQQKQTQQATIHFDMFNGSFIDLSKTLRTVEELGKIALMQVAQGIVPKEDADRLYIQGSIIKNAISSYFQFVSNNQSAIAFALSPTSDTTNLERKLQAILDENKFTWTQIKEAARKLEIIMSYMEDFIVALYPIPELRNSIGDQVLNQQKTYAEQYKGLFAHYVSLPTHTPPSP